MSSSELVVPGNDIDLGQCWAAIRENVAVGIIMMTVPNDVDFEEYRKRAVSCLELAGEPKSGILVEREGRKVFIQRLTHKNRSKNKDTQLRTPKEYAVYEPRKPL